jgi:glycosyltransferase involved in cell wall biosynthesis
VKFTIVGPAYPLRGGIAHHVFQLQQELISRRHQVQVVSFHRLYPKLFFPGTSTTDPSTLKFDPGAEPILDSCNPLTWHRAYKTVRSFRPDGIILEWWHPFFALLLGSLSRGFRKAGLKCIIECHNVFPHERSMIDRWLLSFSFSPVQFFLTHSRTDRDAVLELLPGKVVRVAPLLTLSKFPGPQGPISRPRTLLFFGIVRKYKGLEVLLRAMPKVLSQIECELLVAGEFYEPVDRYLRIIREVGIERHVHITNRYIPNEEVGELFGRADVLVLPYLSASQSGVAQIALAKGLPIVASKTGGLPEVITENVNGLLVPAGDSDALAEAIIAYFARDLMKTMKENLLSSRPVLETEGAAKIIEEMASGN